MTENEFDYISWIQKQLKRSPDVLIGSGDDAAVVKTGKNKYIVVTTDTIVEDIDFKIAQATPESIGYKSIAVSLSDIAAMGQGKPPLYALITVAFPKRINTISFRHRLFKGMHQLSRKYNVSIIGGDISSTKGPLVITSTIFAHKYLPILTRAGAKAGDVIMVTGQLGGSLSGKHLSFSPRINESLYLNGRYKINSMIDISDGLCADIGHICSKSKVGARLLESLIPVTQSAIKISCKTGKSPIQQALYDGEDFELLFTAKPSETSCIIKNGKVKVYPIGFITKEQGIWLHRTNGSLKYLKPAGYKHF
ncbi:MAG: thiamine-phosphate kinase [Candidatus Brocadiia bacterium]